VTTRTIDASTAAVRAQPVLLAAIPDEWGPKAGATSGAVALTRIGPEAIAFTAPAHFAIVLFTPQSGRETALASNHTKSFTAPVGTLEIMPAAAEFSARWSIAKKNALFAIEPARLAKLAAAEFDLSAIELHPPKPGTVDRQALQIANLVREAIRHGGALNELYIDSLVTLFSLHLLRSYSSMAGLTASEPGRPVAGQAWRVVVDYMHDHMAERISIAALAAEARLSPSHFLHAFGAAFGRSPHRYLMDLRLERAERLIVETNLPLATIAEITGFSSQSHLTTSMQNGRSTTPGRLRRLNKPVISQPR
jgi:AraC family transcriptional regulator